MKSDRRIFVIQSAVSLATLAAATTAVAMAGPVTDEKDPKAVELGYRNDAAKVDAAKYPKYAAGQTCGSCLNFQGKPGIAAGPCSLLPKPVLAFGWCSAYSKKN